MNSYRAAKTALRFSASLIVLTALATGTPARTSPAGRAPPRRRTTAAALGGSHATPQALDGCTMAVPSVRATVDVEIANASDFCELVSHALAGDVFHAPVLVTPGLLWHYADAALSCRLRYRSTPYRMTIRNSVAACRWFRRIAPAWHVDLRAVEAARHHRRALHVFNRVSRSRTPRSSAGQGGESATARSISSCSSIARPSTWALRQVVARVGSIGLVAAFAEEDKEG